MFCIMFFANKCDMNNLLIGGVKDEETYVTYSLLVCIGICQLFRE